MNLGLLLLVLALPGGRDPFQYVDEARPAPKPPARSAAKAAPVAVPPPEAPRLVALVRSRRAGLRAALSLGSDVVLCGPGEWLQGYEVLSVDEDSGVRLRSPDGRTLLLPP